MAHFLVINPNTSAEMTGAIANTVRAYIHAENKVDVLKAEMGPESLETFYEYGLATVGVLATLEKVELSQYQGVLLACFGDPGLYALKEKIPVPVIGIAEASIAASLLLGSSFAILVALEKAVPMMGNMVQQYGLTDRFAGSFSLGMNVLDLEQDQEKTFRILLEAGEKALAAGAEVLILGCAGLTGFSTDLEKSLGIPIIDPVRTGLKILESIVESNLQVSKKGLYRPPDSKKISGMPFIKGGEKL